MGVFIRSGKTDLVQFKGVFKQGPPPNGPAQFLHSQFWTPKPSFPGFGDSDPGGESPKLWLCEPCFPTAVRDSSYELVGFDAVFKLACDPAISH